jgi:hypothetical protein
LAAVHSAPAVPLDALGGGITTGAGRGGLAGGGVAGGGVAGTAAVPGAVGASPPNSFFSLSQKPAICH